VNKLDKELLMIIAMGSGGILGALGGYRWKWLRRFVLPGILGSIALIAGNPALQCLYMTIGLIIAFCLPYGERTPYPVKFLVGCAFVAPTLFLGFSIWQIITPVVFIVLFRLSNWKPFANIVFWKAWEFIVFSMVGITVASLIQ